MDFELLPLNIEQDFCLFKKDMQEAFQQGAVEEFGKVDGEILPENDILRSLNENGAVAYKAIVNGEMVGGAIVVINEETNHNHLDFLYVKSGIQSKGIGLAIWTAIEKLYPNTVIWETCTPYFEKRNIHFYVNRCKFHIVEFYNPKHIDPKYIDPNPSDETLGGDYFFRFEKKMK